MEEIQVQLQVSWKDESNKARIAIHELSRQQNHVHYVIAIVFFEE